MTIDLRFFQFFGWRCGFWFRVFGHGLIVTLADVYRPFSERHGYTKAFYFAGLRVAVLRPKTRPRRAE